MFDTMRIGAAGAGGAYEIERSLRCSSADTAYLSKTPTAGNRKTWTLSFWVKRGQLDRRMVMGAYVGSQSTFAVEFNTGGWIDWYDYTSGYNYRIQTNKMYRDPSSWYHFVLALDTTQGSSSDRCKIFVNGVQQTSLKVATYPSVDYEGYWSSNIQHSIGTEGSNVRLVNDCYLAEIHFLDGVAAIPSSFGETNEDTGQWVPKKYAGSYGSQGYYLNFSDNSGTGSTQLGDDDSGNGNDWTLNNFSVTADTAGNDSVLDTPTNNWATWNPLHWCALQGAGGTSLGPDYTQGNLRFVGPSSATSPWQRATGATMVVNSGAWYFEVTIENFSNGNNIGVADADNLDSNGDFVSAGRWMWNCWDTIKNIAGTETSYGSKPSNGDVIGCAVDIDNNTIEWFVNNTSQGETTSIGISGKQIIIGAIQATFSNERYTANFGQQGFKYTPPTGFKALCTANLPDPTITKSTDHFNTVLYTGNGSTQSITGVGFQPDWTWVKKRNSTSNQFLTDSVTGTGKELNANLTSAQGTNANGITAFGADGFSVGTDGGVNGNTDTFVAWNWEGGGSASTNGTGTIDVSLNTNPTAGFSIGTYSGNDTGGATIGHGLGVAPDVVIVKWITGGDNWNVYNKNAGDGRTLWLDDTGVISTGSVYYTSFWNDTAPSSTVTTLGSNGAVNGSSRDYVVFSFASVEGYSKFGSYLANGNTNGTFVYTGFRPALVIFKNFSGNEAWSMFDNKRDPHNPVAKFLRPSEDNADTSGSNDIDFLSNGFKPRTTNNPNTSGATYFYMAFAESPFKYSNAR